MTLFIYLISRLFQLTLLPVFADEAIYIHWAQIMSREPEKYAFFPLYDGKTPLFMWVLAPLYKLAPSIDPLWIGRFVSVLSGLGTLYVIRRIVKILGGSKRAETISTWLMIILPMQFFFNRMALIDSLLTLFLSLSYYQLLKSRAQNYRWVPLLGAGVWWGLALMTKTSAFYYALIPWGVLAFDNFTKVLKWNYVVIGRLLLAGICGLIPLILMRFSDFFPFLFQRSSDFAFSPVEIITQFPHIISLNVYRIGKWLWIYLTPGLWLSFATFAVLVWRRYISPKQKSIKILSLSLGLFLLPFLVTGKLLSSRYFMPVVIFTVPLTAFILDAMFQFRRFIAIFFSLLIIYFSLAFVIPALTKPELIPFANEDKVQYLTEWSSGYGIPEVRDLLKIEALDSQVYVATEGTFGTLPDGLSIYFDNSPILSNLEIKGIGQPIKEIDMNLSEKAKTAKVFVVVNSHRFLVNPLPNNLELVNSYKRPLDGPSLLLYRVHPLQ